MGIEPASSFFVLSVCPPRFTRSGLFSFGVPMKTAFSILALTMILSACAGNRSEQTPTINGNNNTVTINQTPSTEKSSKTDIDAAGSGYGDVK